MTTALDIITGAAKLLGITYKSETLPAEDAADGLVALNDMLGMWSNDGLLIYADTIENFSLTGASSYTIGSGGAFNTVRPTNIVSALIRASSIDYPLEVLTPLEYQTNVAVKTNTSDIPEYITYDNAYPLGTIKFSPLDIGGVTLVLQSRKPFTSFSGLATTVSLPPGWDKALKYNLAIDLAPQYGQEPTTDVRDQSRKSLGAIKRATLVNRAMPLLTDISRTSNIISDAS